MNDTPGFTAVYIDKIETLIPFIAQGRVPEGWKLSDNPAFLPLHQGAEDEWYVLQFMWGWPQVNITHRIHLFVIIIPADAINNPVKMEHYRRIERAIRTDPPNSANQAFRTYSLSVICILLTLVCSQISQCRVPCHSNGWAGARWRCVIEFTSFTVWCLRAVGRLQKEVEDPPSPWQCWRLSNCQRVRTVPRDSWNSPVRALRGLAENFKRCADQRVAVEEINGPRKTYHQYWSVIGLPFITRSMTARTLSLKMNNTGLYHLKPPQWPSLCCDHSCCIWPCRLLSNSILPVTLDFHSISNYIHCLRGQLRQSTHL